MSHKSSMHGGGESYSGIVPAKQPNKSGQPPAEAVEGRPLTKENTSEPNSHRTPCRGTGSSGLERVREAARKDGKLKLTALLHHVSIDLLRSSYHSLKKQAAPGVDGMTWEDTSSSKSRSIRMRGGKSTFPQATSCCARARTLEPCGPSTAAPSHRRCNGRTRRG